MPYCVSRSRSRETRTNRRVALQSFWINASYDRSLVTCHLFMGRSFLDLACNETDPPTGKEDTEDFENEKQEQQRGPLLKKAY